MEKQRLKILCHYVASFMEKTEVANPIPLSLL
jgi:hypothetical protein